MSESAEPIHDLSTATLAADLDDLDSDALRVKVREHLVAKNLSQSAAAKIADIAESTFSAFLKGNYKGNNSKVEHDVRVWLRSVEAFAGKRRISLRDAKFALTGTANKFIAALVHAQSLPDVAVIIAGAGVGKTTTCEDYQKTHPSVWLFTGDPSLQSYGKMLETIRDRLGIPKMPPYKLSQAIADRLSNTQGLLIFDEAQHFNTKCVDMLRSLHDRSKIGMAFVGNDKVWDQIQGGGRDSSLAQLFSRVGVRVTVDKPTPKDIEIILDTLEITDPKHRKILKTVAEQPGALRALDKVLNLALIVADGAGEPLSEAHLMRSWSRFTGRKIGVEAA